MWSYMSPKLLSTSLHSTQRKIQQTMQHVSSNTVLGGGHSVPFWSFFIPLKLNCCSHVYSNTVHWDTTLKEHSHACLHICLQPSTYKPSSYPCTYLNAFYFYIFSYSFLRSTLFEPASSLSLHHSFLCLQSPCHHTANAKPTDFNPMPTALHLTSFRGKQYCDSLGI
jgi:hypothetical protein